MIISRTPFRVSFFGGGTDYPAWYGEHKGAVLATTINKYTYISCRYLPPFFDFKHRVIYSKIEMAKKIDSIQHPSVRECLRFMKVSKGVEIHYDADLPARTGLGSSSSFTVGMLHALYALKGRMPTKRQLALEAIKLEQGPMKENVGSQDQVMAAFGGFNLVEFRGECDIRVYPVHVSLDRVDLLQKHFMLFFTGFSRIASEVAHEQITNIPRRKKELKEMYQMVYRGLDILKDNGRIDRFGKLLHESWKLKRTLSSKVSTPAIDDIYAAARSAGAKGGKLLGAGGGGFLLIFADPKAQKKIRQKLKKLLYVPFRFDGLGSQIIFYSPWDYNQYEPRP